MSDKDGGMAFPCNCYRGMTLRDYLAAKAMQAGMVNATELGEISALERKEMLQRACALFYEVADEMLIARNK